MRNFLLNLVLAILWLLLQSERHAGDFAVGYVVGFALIALCRRVLRSEDYVRRSIAFLRFLAVFLWEFLIANVRLVRVALFHSRESLNPNFITYDVTGMTDLEILLLAYCISLTPGTTSVDVSDNSCTLWIHALEADAPDEIRRNIDQALKRHILAFTR